MSFDLHKQIVDLTRRATQNLQGGSLSFSLSLLKQAEELASPSYVPRYLKTMIFFAYANYFQAIGHHQKSLAYLGRILKMTQDKATLAKAHLNIGYILSLLGQHPKSLMHNMKALNFLESSEEYEGIASAYHALGLEFQHMNQMAKAMASYKQGLMMSRTHLGVNHRLTKILRNLYLEGSKSMVLANVKVQLRNRYENIELGQIVHELETPLPKYFTPLPKTFHHKISSPLPKKQKILLHRSIQCGTDDSPIFQTLRSTDMDTRGSKGFSTSHSKYRANRSTDMPITLVPVPDKRKIVIKEKKIFMIPRGSDEDKAAVLIQRKFRAWKSRRYYQAAKSAAIKIQKWWKMVRARKRFLLFKQKTLMIQKDFRGFRTRKLYRFLLPLQFSKWLSLYPKLLIIS